MGRPRCIQDTFGYFLLRIEDDPIGRVVLQRLDEIILPRLDRPFHGNLSVDMPGPQKILMCQSQSSGCGSTDPARAIVIMPLFSSRANR